MVGDKRTDSRRSGCQVSDPVAGRRDTWRPDGVWVHTSTQTEPAICIRKVLPHRGHAAELGGFAIKATTLRWLEGIGDLRAITVGSNRKDKAVQTEITLRFSKK